MPRICCALLAPTAICAMLTFAFPSVGAQAQQARVSLSIPAQPLPQALLVFAQQTHLSILASDELTAGLRSAAVSGVFTEEEGLRRILSESGLKFDFVDASSVRIYSENASPSAKKTGVKSKPAKPAEMPEPAELQELMVTAQKRAQPLDEVPIAVTVLTAEQIADFKIEQISDLARLTPGFTYSGFSNGTPFISIRGAANKFGGIGIDKPVAIMVDDVFIPRYADASFDLFDLAQAEVLRGPQGTLFGRNVTGGVVVLTTAKPNLDTMEAQLETGIGNYGSYEFKASLNGPVSDDVAVKLVVSREAHDGYGKDILLDRELDNQDDLDARGQLLWKPSADFSVLLSADVGDDHNNGRDLTSLGLGSDGNPRDSEQGYPQGFSRHIAGGSARVDWSVDPGTLTSITAYRTSNTNDLYAYIAAPFLLLPAGDYQEIDDEAEKDHTFTQELRFTSRSFGRFNFVSGLYYMHEDGTKQYSATDLVAPTGAYTFGSPTIDYEKALSQSYAAYVDGTVHILDSVDLSVGARYTEDRKTDGETQVNLTQPSYNFSQSGLSGSWGRTTPRAVLTWYASDNSMLYASWAKGYTAGGFNTEASQQSGFDAPFKPESATNYEIGSKTNWFDRRLNANISLFDTEYRDKQEYFYTQTNGVDIFNAARATARGAELEVAAKATQNLQISANYGYLFSKYDSFPEQPADVGHTLANSPRNKFGVTVVDTIPLGHFGELHAAASYTWQGSYYTDFTQSPYEFVKEYGLLNSSIAYIPNGSNWKFTLWGKNLLDKDYALVPSFAENIPGEWLGPPRTFGATAAVKF
jgi:iron complex outermembrane recepter protein